jgi:carnitine 3-dehydrogenase
MSTVISKAACIGSGVIGAGWAARMLWNGVDVHVFDPNPEARRQLDEVIANADRAMAKLTLAPRPVKGTLIFTNDLAEAVREADFIQESVPEREDLKKSVYAEIETYASPDALICSSTSGILPSNLQADMKYPGRFMIGHPFNPVYLLPLVEVCGGKLTGQAEMARAEGIYKFLGMHPLMLRKEIDGFVADRLMEALWREALWLVKDDVATAAEIDDAIRLGAGLRWAQMGTFMTYRIAGGEGGMRHFMEQFGPSLKWPWTKLMNVPEMDDALLDKIAGQSDDQARTQFANRDFRELERLRDDCLVSTLQALKVHSVAGGADLAAFEADLYARAHPADKAEDSAPADINQPLRLYETAVLPDWVDYNNHMTESRYLQVFGDASDAFTRSVGIDTDYLEATGSYFTVETHIMHLDEVAGLEPIYTTTQVLGLDEKRLHVFHRIHHGRTDAVLASAEQMLLHVGRQSRKACGAEPVILARLQEVMTAHEALDKPDHAGRSIGIKPKA